MTKTDLSRTIADMDAMQQEDPVNVRQPPISILNTDVLWHVFHLNANMNNDKGFRVYPPDRIDVEERQSRALFVTWASSQVCRQWRHILINSPVIWGRLVDLDGFSSAGAAFRDEVMHRSGSSILWIFGKVFAQKDSERDFFTSTLARNWTRIGRLRVTLQQSKLIPEHAWKVLYEPAPYLQFLSLRSSEGINLPLPDDQNANLFANEAPLLRKFTSWKINFKFGNAPGWMSHIRNLDISYMNTTMGQWLEMLEQCPQIESLLLIKPFLAIADATQKFHSVKLPNLEAIAIIHELISCVLFLDHILPRNGCYLQLNTPDDMDDPLSAPTIALAKRVLTRYSTSWFNNQFVSSFLLSISHQEIRIGEQDVYLSEFEDKLFSIQISCQNVDDLPTLFSLLDIFSSCKLENITSLHFKVDIFPEQSLNAEVFQFLLRMSSVQTLKFWHLSTISTLLSLALNPDVNNEANNPTRTTVFPLLGTLHIETRKGFYDQETLDTFQKQILRFLLWRRDIGHFVEILDITSLEDSARIHIFDRMHGLKVLHQDGKGIQREYICQGSPRSTISGQGDLPVS